MSDPMEAIAGWLTERADRHGLDAVDKFVAEFQAAWNEMGLVTPELRARWRFYQAMDLARPNHWRWACSL